MPVAELLTRTSSAELTEWMAYEKITGTLGPERGDLHAGITASTIANVNRGKRSKRFRPQDFMPKWDRPSASTPQAMKALLMSWSKRVIRRSQDGGDG